MTGPIVVVEMTLGVTTWSWLCQRHIARRQAAGWAVKRKDVVAFGCYECGAEHQVSPGYVTPTPDVELTSPGARRPTRQECPPPRAIAPWAKPGERSRQRTVSEEVRA